MTLDYIDGASFVSAYRAIFGHQVYAFEGSKKGVHIIDGGANIGLATIFWKHAYPGAEIDAYEPDESAMHALLSNVSRLGLTGVSVNDAAIWTEKGEMAFTSEGADGGRLDAHASGPPVTTVALRDLLAREVDFLKLDIEGAETAVLESATDCLRNARRVFVEYHSFVDEPQSLHRVLGLLANCGFRYSVNTEFTSRQPFVSQETDHGMDMRVNISASRLD